MDQLWAEAEEAEIRKGRDKFKFILICIWMESNKLLWCLHHLLQRGFKSPGISHPRLLRELTSEISFNDQKLVKMTEEEDM